MLGMFLDLFCDRTATGRVGFYICRRRGLQRHQYGSAAKLSDVRLGSQSRSHIHTEGSSMMEGEMEREWRRGCEEHA